MAKYYNIKFEQAQILEELKKITGKYLPIVEGIEDFTVGVSIEDKNIVGLGLYKCGLITLPESIGNLKWLQTLWLSNNQLKILPETIGNLTALQILTLSGNKLINLPETIGNLTALQILNLSYNKLTNLPETIGNLTALQILDLSHNKLRTLPESITNFSSIEKLYLSENQLSTLPGSITKLESLQELYLEKNALINLPESFCRLRKLKTVNLSGNKWKEEWKEMANWKGEWEEITELFKICRKLNGIIIFISHAWNDQDQYQVIDLEKKLEDSDIIHEVYICERDLVGNIWEFMTENVLKSHLLLFIATNNSIVSEACQYELSLAKRYGVEILPIKGNDINWRDLNHIDLNEYKQGYLDLSKPKEKVEFNSENFDNFFDILHEYIKKNEPKLKFYKKEQEKLENEKLRIKKIIFDYIESKEFREDLKENFEKFNKILYEVSNNQITSLQYFLKWSQIINKKIENK